MFDELRGKLLAGEAKLEELVDVEGIGQVLLIEPTVAEQEKIWERSKVPSGFNADGTPKLEISNLMFRVRSLIATVHDPKERKPLFSDSDIEVLIGKPAKSQLYKLAAKATSLVNGVAATAEKN